MKFRQLSSTILPDVELILTPEEATALAAVLGKISGYMGEQENQYPPPAQGSAIRMDSSSPRSFLTELYRKLDDYVPRPRGGPITWRDNKFKFSYGMRVDKL